MNPIPSPWETRKLPTSGTIKLSQIKSEFNKGNNLVDYLGVTTGIPSNPPIKITDFYGKESTQPITTLQVTLDGPIDEEFTNGVAIYWKIRKYSQFLAGSPQYGGYFTATGQGKFPCFWQPSASAAESMISEFEKRTYFGLCGKGISENILAGWTWVDMSADNNRTEVLVYPSKHSSSNSTVLQFCNAIDAGSGAEAAWYM